MEPRTKARHSERTGIGTSQTPVVGPLSMTKECGFVPAWGKKSTLIRKLTNSDSPP